jgi:hypothetical protein
MVKNIRFPLSLLPSMGFLQQPPLTQQRPASAQRCRPHADMLNYFNHNMPGRRTRSSRFSSKQLRPQPKHQLLRIEKAKQRQGQDAAFKSDLPD